MCSSYPYFCAISCKSERSSVRGFMCSSAFRFRFSQCSIRSTNSWQPQPTPPSRKANLSSGEPPRDAAEEDPLGRGVARLGEVADVVEGEVHGRVPERHTARARVERGRDLELDARLPERVVVVQAVGETDRIVPDREAFDVAVASGDPLTVRLGTTEWSSGDRQLLIDLTDA